jgi:hypothetical protein
LTDLNFYLADLLEQPAQRALLASFVSAQVFTPILEKYLAALRALPPALTAEPPPLAQELRDADETHDKAVRAIHALLRAYQLTPHSASSALAPHAKTLQEKIVPDLSIVRASYLDEAREVERRAERMRGHEGLLDLFSVEGGTLAAWYKLAQEAGQRLASLLAQRAQSNVDNLPSTTRAEAITLRSNLLGTLQQMRQMLQLEQDNRPDLPQDATARLFRFLDESVAKREAARDRQAPPQDGPAKA